MSKLTTSCILFFAAATLVGVHSRAQQTPAGTAPASAPKAQSAPAKTGQAATPKSPAGTAKSATKSTAKGPAVALKTQKEKASYAIGLNIGKSMKKDAVDIDPALLSRGIRDALAGNKPLLSDADAQAALMALQADLRKKQEEKLQIAGEANKKEGEAFLAANKSKEGVVALPSGLQYKILKEGTGPKPTAADTVICNYRGTLLDNTEFDSSYKRGQPATFPVGQVIKGWTEALQLMPVGSKWQLFVPSELAYGPRGVGGDIGPNSTLIFEVELLSIQGKEAGK